MAVKALGNITVTYDSLNITQYLNTQSLNAVIAQIDTTNLASSGDEKIAGSGAWEVAVGGMWAKALDDKLGADAVTPPSTLKTLVIVVGAAGSTVTYTWTTNAFVGGYTIDTTDPKGMIGWSGTLAVSGAPSRT
jgi:hypothetical protein